MQTYVALVIKEPDTDFGVHFPDFPGCITAGRTMKEAFLLAHEALALHIQGMLEDGEKIPEPTDVDDLMATPENQDAMPMMVTVSEDNKPVRLQITLPSNLVHQIELRSHNKSAWLAEAAAEKLRK